MIFLTSLCTLFSFQLVSLFIRYLNAEPSKVNIAHLIEVCNMIVGRGCIIDGSVGFGSLYFFIEKDLPLLGYKSELSSSFLGLQQVDEKTFRRAEVILFFNELENWTKVKINVKIFFNHNFFK